MPFPPAGPAGGGPDDPPPEAHNRSRGAGVPPFPAGHRAEASQRAMSSQARGPHDPFELFPFGGLTEILARSQRRVWVGLGFVAAALAVVLSPRPRLASTPRSRGTAPSASAASIAPR